MCDAEFLADLAHVALGPAFVLHNAGAADHFQIGHFRQISQDLALHSIGEISVLFLFAPVLKRKHGNTFLGNREVQSWFLSYSRGPVARRQRPNNRKCSCAEN